ncbi:DNA alkylation repair protein [Nocardia brasiliensis]|uniref:DNA alkylation repair protein n=1 Tax=Nocardia brasiliensis TaxID=37326 RepID=UPI0024538832|nr:DNA alkylation repair protein [Nocardia brasiliensis]
MGETAVADVLAELAGLEDPKIRAVNEKHGDEHGVNLTQLRAVAKQLKTQQDLARELWATGDATARLLATLICRPQAFERDELDRMLRGARAPKVHDWLVNYVVKKNPHAEHRARAIDIGERLQVLAHYPTPPNCTSPFAPIWIAEMVRRQGG